MRNAKATLMLVGALALGAGAVAMGAASNPGGGPISACYLMHGANKGTLRLLLRGRTCRHGERKVTWNRQGVAGLPGTPGTPGATGAPGPSEAFNQGLFPGGPGLTLAAGSYDVRASVNITNGGGAPLDVTCTLTIGTPSSAPGAKDIETVTVAPGAKVVLSLEQIHQLADPGPANASCDGGLWGGLLIALRVGLVHEI
jgi:hypothetical protein